MKRRDFVLSAAGAVGVASLATYFIFDNTAYDPAIAQPRSLSLIFDDKMIVAIGKKYREQFPGESSANALAGILKSTGPHIEDQVTQDFKTRNTVIVDGWILSITEARQCALASTQEK